MVDNYGIDVFWNLYFMEKTGLVHTESPSFLGRYPMINKL
jgi:hypothetical protein